MYTKICRQASIVQIFVAQNFHEKISHHKTIIVNILLLHILVVIVGYFL